MEVVDAGSVVATGEGLSSAEVNHRSTFFLNLGHNGSASDVKAHVICRFESIVHIVLTNLTS